MTAVHGSPEAREVLTAAIARRAFPAAAIEVGSTAGASWTEAFGRLTYEDDAAAVDTDTLFDLASLTKVLATTPIVMRLVERGHLALTERAADWIDAWRGDDREHVTVRDLLAHSSGLTAHLPFYRDHTGRADFERAIATLPLEYPAQTRAIYSDLGFILLAFIAENAAGHPFDRQFDELVQSIGVVDLMFRPASADRARSAPTGVDRWRGRLLAGEVHDSNAWALGGAAGHAGLFGTAAAVGAFARSVLRGLRLDTDRQAAGDDGRVAALASPSTLRTFATRTADVPGSSRALGWDTMLPTSSCGTLMNPSAIGHTGFTGTSLWIDWEADLYAVLLTNRVYPDDQNQEILRVRPAFHDAVIRGGRLTGC